MRNIRHLPFKNVHDFQYIKQLMCCMFLVAALTALHGCGFKLRGSQALPNNIETVFLVSDLRFSPLQRSLDKRLPVYQLNSVISDETQLSANDVSNAVVIRLQPEALERRLLSIFSSGQVAEYELVYSVNYTVQFGSSSPIKASMSVSREYQDDPDQVLAKSRELDLIVEEMRLDTSDRIIRKLSNQFSASMQTTTQDVQP